jgi:hypothetical protein
MKKTYIPAFIALLIIAIGCDTIKNLPTNTSGGLFSLNGNWQLTTTNDNNTLSGSIVTVFPGVADGTVKSLSNNSLCFRERDVLWKGISNTASGSFSMNNLVNACNNQTVYKTAVITVLTTDEIRVTSQNSQGNELIQTWKRLSGK